MFFVRSVPMTRISEKLPDTSQKVLPSIQALSDELSKTPKGAIPEAARDEIITLLAHCWRDLQGAGETSMEDWKLNRLEDLSWNPPLLSFTIERHGGTVLGSTRAELHKWTVNVTLGSASCTRGRYRQLVPTAPRLDVKPIAARVCDSVQQGPASNCELVKQGIVVWHGGDHILIKHGVLIPNDGYQRTISGRRRKFCNELTNMMKPLGWELVSVQRFLKFRKI
jgi:hypothetical protein